MKDRDASPEPGAQEKVQPGYLGPTPPPSRPPAKGQRLYVERPEQLLDAVEVLRTARIIGVDAEFVQGRSRLLGENGPSHRLALLQLAIDGQCFVIDAWRLADLSPLAVVTENAEISILLHGAGADLHVMAERGLNVAHYFDLEAASRSIFGQNESSLAAMLQRAFGIHLDKSLQRTDWARRPLPPAMVAYAARDAEMTLALYYWLDEHYHDILVLHEYVGELEPVADWIEPFLRGSSSLPAELAVAEARAKGLLSDEQIYADCRAALASLRHPMRRSRLLRLIADLSLSGLAPELEALLKAPTSDERAAAARALGRLGHQSSREAIRSLLQDPVYDVRKAAQSALRTLNASPRPLTAQPTRLTDGSRSWTIGEESDDAADDSDWKARLRSLMDE
ncbi:HEAT repeat domain-containing protein [Thermogemmatispora onikobensis]|uniref:HEAT repeat domain-containing protein n=1 Tax=Thermogemmatispora onikobensis TaxID=732234 RepID=UPI0008538320|nr:HEAT repeat domain-containing protein [Thermogemmatispora onikobensis]